MAHREPGAPGHGGASKTSCASIAARPRERLAVQSPDRPAGGFIYASKLPARNLMCLLFKPDILRMKHSGSPSTVAIGCGHVVIRSRWCSGPKGHRYQSSLPPDRQSLQRRNHDTCPLRCVRFVVSPGSTSWQFIEASTGNAYRQPEAHSWFKTPRSQPARMPLNICPP